MTWKRLMPVEVDKSDIETYRNYKNAVDTYGEVDRGMDTMINRLYRLFFINIENRVTGRLHEGTTGASRIDGDWPNGVWKNE